MPIYEYRCSDCKTLFSKRRSMSEADAPVTCPECEGTNARRTISLFAAHSATGGVIAGGGGGCSGCTSTSCSACGSARA